MFSVALKIYIIVVTIVECSNDVGPLQLSSSNGFEGPARFKRLREA